MLSIHWPELTSAQRITLITPPKYGKVPIVIDSDTYNEIDDQMAIAWAFLHPERLDLQAVYAAPFTNHYFGKEGSHTYVDDPAVGMQLSVDEIYRVFNKLPRRENIPQIFQGSTRYLKDSNQPEMSAAVQDLINRARTAEQTLHVLAIAAPTNIANALLLAPDIVTKIHVIWLGGNSYAWKDNHEFNLMQDIAASKIFSPKGTYRINAAKRAWIAKAPPTVRNRIALRFSEHSQATSNRTTMPSMTMSICMVYPSSASMMLRKRSLKSASRSINFAT